MDSPDFVFNNIARYNEVESICYSKIGEIRNELDRVAGLLNQSRASDSAWKILMDKYNVLCEIQSRIHTIAEALEWDLNQKPAWEKEHKRKFNPTLECGDG